MTARIIDKNLVSKFSCQSDRANNKRFQFQQSRDSLNTQLNLACQIQHGEKFCNIKGCNQCQGSFKINSCNIYTSCSLPDPRFMTHYISDYLPSTEVFYDTTSCKHGGPWFHQSKKLFVPLYVANPSILGHCDSTKCQIKNTSLCAGYNPVRADKGYMLTVNDYPYDNVELIGGNWNQYVMPLHHPSQ